MDSFTASRNTCKYFLHTFISICLYMCAWMYMGACVLVGRGGGGGVCTWACVWNAEKVDVGPVTLGESPRAGTFGVGNTPCCKLLMQQDRGKGIAWPPAVTDSGKMKIQHLCTCSPDGEGRKSHYRVTGDKKPKSTSATHPTAGD